MRYVAFVFLLVFVAGCSNESKDPTGAKLFDDNCARCHGTDGSGGTNGQPNIQGETLARIQNAIANVGAMQQALGNSLSAAEVELIAEYVATLGTTSSKLTALIFGAITVGDEGVGMVEVIGNNGESFIVDTNGAGEFVANIADLDMPYVLRFQSDDTDVAFYGYGWGDAVEVSISEASDEALSSVFADIDTVIETCTHNCFNELYQLDD